MTEWMSEYYAVDDPYKGRTCTLTGIRCCNVPCTECVFAEVAYKQAMKEKEKRSEERE